ncbi:MAG: hypothetical protein CMF49_01620 [Legionellales bacterium]|nr:hypothetical protein [Legionellales bacterium]|tara:strand:+ start:229 stop:876 length:648 start_codon:yes stop_codon:yes gene_type:complete
MSRQLILTILLLLTPISLFAASSPHINKQAILADSPDLQPVVLDYALNGYQWALTHGHVKNPDILTIVDFTKPSYEKRMWVIDLKNGKQLMKLRTTHGKNSGGTYATHFSNRPGTDASSLGVYEITNSYYGKHGLSARLAGLEPGINNNARSRAIVIHPASYVTPSYVARNHRAGRSWGCFGVDPAKSRKLVDLTKNGTVLFAYAKPEKHDPVVA